MKWFYGYKDDEEVKETFIGEMKSLNGLVTGVDLLQVDATDVLMGFRELRDNEDTQFAERVNTTTRQLFCLLTDDDTYDEIPVDALFLSCLHVALIWEQG